MSCTIGERVVFFHGTKAPVPEESTPTRRRIKKICLKV